MEKYGSLMGLCVAWLLAMVLAPPNTSARLGDYDYCDPILCGEGEGDCDGNFDCQPGLVCVNDQGAYYPNFPPPSANYDPSIVDVCEAPDPDLCRDFGPCPAGNGDCDSNSECQAGLTCVNDVGARYGYPANYDVCEARSGDGRGQPGHADYCRDYGPCSAGQGDCDPGQCASGLVCANDVGARYGLPAHYDVCEARSGDGRGQPGHADYCRDYGPCSAGQGDCDPGQCASGLVCANDVGARYGLPAHYDVCEARSGDGRGQPGHADYCRDYGPCSAGQGDCDPGQCASGLVCANDVGARYGLPAHYDVCEARSDVGGSPPQAQGSDIPNVTVIGQGTIQRVVAENRSAQQITFRQGDWFEPKDGSYQRMIIQRTITVGRGQRLEIPAACKQQSKRVPATGLSFFSQPKSPASAIDRCQVRCLNSGAPNTQSCVWQCERDPNYVYRAPASIQWRVTDSCNDRRRIEYRFFEYSSPTSGTVTGTWPGGNQYYYTPGFDRTVTHNLSCTPGRNVCFGARRDGDNRSYWGVGFDGDQGCERCCQICPSSGQVNVSYRAGC